MPARLDTVRSILKRSSVVLMSGSVGDVEAELGDDLLEPAGRAREGLLERHDLLRGLRPDGLELAPRLEALGRVLLEPALHDGAVGVRVLLVSGQQLEQVPERPGVLRRVG